jgi:membrane protease YdiL (CAAX protease family)
MERTELIKAHFRRNLRTYALMGLVLSGMIVYEMLFMLVVSSLGLLKIATASVAVLPSVITDVIPASLGLTAFIACIMAPIVEESFFRWLPISLATDEEGRLRKPFGLALIFVWSCLFFGFVHGYNYMAVVHKAPAGLMLAGLWWANRHDWKKALFSCMAVHAVYNVVATIIEYFLAKAYMQGAQDAAQAILEKLTGS